MAKFRDNQTSFVAGEISPTALARTDLPAYKHGARLMRNMIPLPSGGGYRRPGTKFQFSYAMADYNAAAPRIIPFVYSESEFAALVLHRYVGSGFVGIHAPSDNTSYTASAGLASGTHTYTNSQLPDIQYAQSADVLTLVHPSVKPNRIYRTAANTFYITPFDHDSSGTQLTGTAFREAWPYLNQNTTAITFQLDFGTVGTGRVLNSSAAFFTPEHVGAVFKIDDAGTTGCCLVTAYTASNSVTVQVIVAFGANAIFPNRLGTWWESAWSNHQGWPRTVDFFQGRIIYGGCTGSADSIWHSQTSNYNVLSKQLLVLADSAGDGATTGPKGANPFTLTFASPRLDAIQWMAAEKTLAVGTQKLEWIVDKFDQTAGYGADNLNAVVGSHFGSAYNQAVRAGNELVFNYQSEHELKSLVFNVIQNSYVDESVQLLYDEFPYAETFYGANGNRKIKHFAWDGTRKTLWCIDTMGNLRGMTRDRNLQVTAWHSHQLGGYDSTKTGGEVVTSGLCAGSVLSVAVLPNPVLGVDDVWMIVKRYINGAYYYHLERMIGENYPIATAYTAPNAGSGVYLVDAATFNTNDYPLPETYVRGNLDHLVGETPVGPTFNANGIFYTTGSAVNGSGNTTIQHTYPTGYDTVSSVTVLGLSFSSILEPVRREAGSQIGSAQGAIKRIHEATVRFYRTMWAKVGRDADTAVTINFREPDIAMGSSAELFTGDKLQKFPGTYDRDGYVYIVCDRPLPFAVLSVITEGMTSDGG